MPRLDASTTCDLAAPATGHRSNEPVAASDASFTGDAAQIEVEPGRDRRAIGEPRLAHDPFGLAPPRKLSGMTWVPASTAL